MDALNELLNPFNDLINQINDMLITISKFTDHAELFIKIAIAAVVLSLFFSLTTMLTAAVIRSNVQLIRQEIENIRGDLIELININNNK